MRRFPVRIFFFILMLAACFFIASCGGSSSKDSGDETVVPEAPAMGAWTFMVYMAADNNISNAAKADINEMESVGSSSDVTVVVQAEFNTGESPDLPSSTVRGRVLHDSDQANIGSWYSEIGNKDMTDPETLREFVAWSVEHYPAERYALVLWSHGAGWKTGQGSPLLSKGMMSDTTSSGGAGIMPLTAMAQALEDSGVVFDLVNFDSCLMGMYEVAYEFKDVASYIAFSEHLYPVQGDAYDAILQALVSDPTMDGAELARTAASMSREFYSARKSAMTKSAVDTAQMDELQTALCTLSRYVEEHFDAEKPHIESAFAASVSYESHGHRDFGDFLQQLDTQTVDQNLKDIIGGLKRTLSLSIIANEVFVADPADPLARSQGMAIYIPSQTQASRDNLDLYSSLACNLSSGATWGDVIYRLVTGTANSEGGKDPGGFAVRIEWDTQADIDLYIFEPGDTAASPRYGDRSGDNGVCSADSFYSGETFEYYESFEQAAPGQYEIFINYYGGESVPSVETMVSCLIRDPSQGMNDYTLIAQQEIDLSNPLGDGKIDDEDRSGILDHLYSDWWYAGSIVRTLPDADPDAAE